MRTERVLLSWLESPTQFLFFTGKGGVGKTSLACATSLELARRGKRVLLVSTDPASNLDQVFGLTVGTRAPVPVPGVEGLELLNIDPESAAQAYRDRIVGPVRGVLPDQTVRSIEEQLSGACTTEIAAFDEFTAWLTSPHAVDHIVFDTAPTGHTLLLIDATGAYHRDVMRHDQGKNVSTPLMRLQDPELTRVLVVTLAETTPVLEAARLQEDLRRAGIEPWAWVINSSLAAAHPHDPVLAARAESELAEIERVKHGLAIRVALVPCLAEKPVGRRALLELAEGGVPTRG